MVKTIIVDDEKHNVILLKRLLSQYFENIDVVATAKSADQAYDEIIRHQPELVLLDIQMPKKSGFDLLRMFKSVDFEIVFVTAYDEYAVAAFEFNAIGYILKPIDHTKLITTLEKVLSKIDAKVNDQLAIRFIKTLEEKSQLVNRISLHHHSKVVFIMLEDIVSINSFGDYCEISLLEEKYTSSKDLILFENLLAQFDEFIKINRSVIINQKFLKNYTKGDVCVVEMRNGDHFEVSRRKKTEINRRILGL